MAKHSCKYDQRKCQDYGCLGGVHGQATGIAAFLNPPDVVTSSVVSITTFDDASMWVKDPASANDRASGRRVEGVAGSIAEIGPTKVKTITQRNEVTYWLDKKR